MSGRAPYHRALEQGEIKYQELVALSRKAEIPHPLFFAPLSFVKAQVESKTKKLLQGVAPDTFTVNSRTTVRLRDVELIIKDLLRKQSLAKRYDSLLIRNEIVGLLRRPGSTPRDDADKLIAALELDLDTIRRARTKEVALEMLIEQIEAKQVLVARSVRGFMPQILDGLHFSGMTVRDSKIPYIFLTGGDHGDFQEQPGRQIFTLMLMTVLVARGVFAPVTYDANSTALNVGREYDIVGEVLMPASGVQDTKFEDIDAVKAAADVFKVTPSAMVVRGMRLGKLSAEAASTHLSHLEDEFRSRPKPGPRNQPKAVNAIRKYNGRALTTRMLRAVEEQGLAEREFCRIVCLNRISPAELSELKAALQ
ncbi:hypothetical protein HQQ82_03410 [Rathayibacter sp. VKM Ac-2856]|uniref:hypothetical protein n=1 Tax=unclassified Rathayibacter TaxID=2609250 RepID=UPI001564A9D1|nr:MULTISPECIES: hypothetical protein [unclassified Rathayibacter]NQX03842.1 hypothetical protein [Rathayibacter sp. VKM Ac-2858]NQX19010.1 hypothetical protein [Rathayibacter sp. VKM Ac-2856]